MQSTMTTAQLFRRFFSYYRPHRGLFLLDFSCAIVSGLLELGFPLAVRSFVDRLLPGQDWGLIALASAALLCVYALNTGLLAIVTYWGHRLAERELLQVIEALAAHLGLDIDSDFYDEQKTGQTSWRVSPRISKRSAKWRTTAPKTC